MLHVLLHALFSGCLTLEIFVSDMERICQEPVISWGYSYLFFNEDTNN